MYGMVVLISDVRKRYPVRDVSIDRQDVISRVTIYPADLGRGY